MLDFEIPIREDEPHPNSYRPDLPLWGHWAADGKYRARVNFYSILKSWDTTGVPVG